MFEKVKSSLSKPVVIIFILIGVVILSPFLVFSFMDHKDDNVMRILSSYENKDLEPFLVNKAKKEHFSIKFEYKGDLDIVDELNANSNMYDAVWISNSMWFYMLDNPYLPSESKSISISPVVFGIRKSRAKELGLVDKEITNQLILDLVMNKKIKYVMPSVTQTNSGAMAYLGFLNSLLGSPEIMTESMISDEFMKKNMINIFSGVERVSGDEGYLEKMFLQDDRYEAIVASESSLININKELKGDDKLYLLYPFDGVPINDSTFSFINNNDSKKEYFFKLQDYLLSKEMQSNLQKLGRRTWYGGVSNEAPKDIFNPSLGIDTSKYLNVTKFPSKKVITKALNTYIEELRKPTHVVFCLDYSGSMGGKGIESLKKAMDYILDYTKASKNKLQFSKYDRVSVVLFGSNIKKIDTATGANSYNLMRPIDNTRVGGGTNLYAALDEALQLLEREDDTYTKTIIAMTDGEINGGVFSSFSDHYKELNNGIPIYSIMFGDAQINQLNDIASLTNAKVFDGRTELLNAFKEVRGYN